MTIRRERKLLEGIATDARKHLATLEDALKVNASPPLLWMRTIVETFVGDADKAIDQHADLFDDEKTPTMSTSASQSFRAASKILDEAKSQK